MTMTRAGTIIATAIAAIAIVSEVDTSYASGTGNGTPSSSRRRGSTSPLFNPRGSRRAQDIEQPSPSPTTPPPTSQLCSCSPRAYDFRINYNGNCNVDTVNGAPGIDGSICFYTKGGDLEAVASGDVSLFPQGRKGRRGLRSVGNDNDKDDDDDDTTGSENAGNFFDNDNEDDANLKWERLLSKASLSSHHRHAATILEQQQQQQNQRHSQALDTRPITITSATFLEFDSDSDLNIINQDSTYFENVTLANGDIISYDSISSQLDLDTPLYDQLDLLPGGVMLVLFGINRNNVMIQNTIAWGYQLEECSAEPLQIGDRISWVSLVDYKSPKAEFCPAVTNMPTVNPTFVPTTDAPSWSPTTPSPTSSPEEEIVEISQLATKSPTLSPVVDTARPTRGAKATKASSGKASKASGKASKAASVDDGTQVGSGNGQDKPYELFAKSTKKGDDGSSSTYQLFHKSSKSSTGGATTTATAKATKLFKQPSSKSSKSTATPGSIQLSRPPIPSSNSKPETPSYSITKPPVVAVSASSNGSASSSSAFPTVQTSHLTNAELDEMIGSGTTTLSPTTVSPTVSPPTVAPSVDLLVVDDGDGVSTIGDESEENI